MIEPITINKDLNEAIAIAMEFESRAMIFAEHGKNTRNKKLEVVTKGNRIYYQSFKDKKLVETNDSMYCAIKHYLEL